MTYQEALEILGQERKYPRVLFFSQYPAMNEAVKLALVAIEKQIPKKPIKPIDLHSSYQCPAYGEVTLPGENYCDGCGQKLLWEERA